MDDQAKGTVGMGCSDRIVRVRNLNRSANPNQQPAQDSAEESSTTVQTGWPLRPEHGVRIRNYKVLEEAIQSGSEAAT